jgi:hypothetical protein
MEKDYKKMSNAEIRIELKNLENEFESLKIKISSHLQKMNELDQSYLNGLEELKKRGVK